MSFCFINSFAINEYERINGSSGTEDVHSHGPKRESSSLVKLLSCLCAVDEKVAMNMCICNVTERRSNKETKVR